MSKQRPKSKARELLDNLIPGEFSKGKTESDEPPIKPVVEEFSPYESKPLERWTIYDLWSFMIMETGMNTHNIIKKGGKNSKNLSLLKKRYGIERLKEVGEWYGNNRPKLRKHFNWKSAASPSEFYYRFADIVDCMENGFVGGIDTRGAEGTVYEEDGSWGDLTKQPEKEYGEDGVW